MELDETERRRIVSDFKAIIAEPLPENRRSIGCMLLLLAAPAAILLPRFLPQRFATDALITVGLVALVGLFFTLFGSSAHYSAVDNRANSGLDLLATKFEQSSPDERRRAALLALAYAHHSDGPSTRAVYDFDQQKARLGSALEYVQAVERVLVAEGLCYPAFTTIEPNK